MELYTVLALKLGNGLIPVVLALYQFSQGKTIAILEITGVVTIVSYLPIGFLSRIPNAQCPNLIEVKENACRNK